MIPYIELLDQYSLKAYALIEPSECWFELSYYDTGEFELYCIATKENLKALKRGAFVKIPNKRFIWFITSITYTYNATGGRMILAKGYEAKYLLSLRAILNPLELPTNLGNAIFKLINNNLGPLTTAERKINNFVAENQIINITINDTQATRSNLLEFTNNLLKTYYCGSYVYIENGVLKYKIIQGRDLTNKIVFSQSQDNLLSSEFYSSETNYKTFARVVSKVEEVDYIKDYDKGPTGIDRKELIVESDLSTKYTDTNGVEKETTPTSELYQGWQVEEGKKALADHTISEEVKGEIDLENSSYIFDEDFFTGDIVKIKDEYFNFASNARIKKVTFKQSAGGYGEELEYGE